jgi:hypothetical protein
MTPLAFDYCPKNGKQEPTPKRLKILKDMIYIHYWDGSDDCDESDAHALSEGE